MYRFPVAFMIPFTSNEYTGAPVPPINMPVVSQRPYYILLFLRLNPSVECKSV